LFKNIRSNNVARKIIDLKAFAEEVPRRITQILRNLSTNQFQVKIQGLDDSVLMQNLQKIANRIASGVVVAALIIGAALMMQIETDQKLLGYPALAIVLFGIAVVLGLHLVLSALVTDRRDSGNRNSPS
jgi:ABC-type polysaccharide/polyol phosphate export permease